MTRGGFAKVRARLRGDSGLTVIELLVAIVLFGILMTIVSTLMISTMRTVALSRDLTANTKSAANAMNETTRAIRAATENPVSGSIVNDPAFIVAKPDDVLFYAYVNVYSDITSAQQPVMIRLRVDRTTGGYVESRWKGTATADGKWVFSTNPCVKPNTPVGCTAPTLTRTLASTISPITTDHPTSPFVYKMPDGITTIANTSAGLGEADRRLVAFVQVNLRTQSSLTDSSDDVTLETIVGIPNLGFAK